MKTAACAVLLGATLWGLTLPADAQMKYVDRDGKSHWVQTEDQIPSEYRSSASRPRLPGAGQGDADQRREYQRKLDGESRIIERQQDETARRVERQREQREADDRMAQALRSCARYKYSPELMNPEQSALCYRAWGDKANRQLGR